jgi:branched-chain amino acid aminotransferase
MYKIEIDQAAVEIALKHQITGDMGFGKYMSPIMIECDFINGQWQQMKLVKYGPIALDPCAKVFHYGQEIFEGMKAYKNEEGEIYLFRPELNARRFNRSAARMSMPQISEEMFIEAARCITWCSRNLVPKRFGESLYLRPFMIATEVALGIKPANQFKFVVVASPVANYFKGSSVKVLIERQSCRAAPGGTGFAKTGGNYAAGLLASTKTLHLGCDQTMWLDAEHRKYIEEMSGMNFFAVINGELHTPTLTDTILEGITRQSIIELAKTHKYKVHERRMDVNELKEQINNGQCSEAFVCGTASVIAPINSLMEEHGETIMLKNPEGDVSQKLKDELLMIQTGRKMGPQGWQVSVHA